MRLDGAVFFSHFFAHRDGDIPGSVAVIAHSAKLLTHEAVSTGVDDFFELRRDLIETVEYTLRHKPARFRSKALEPIELVRRTLGLWPGEIFHRIARAVAVTRAAQNTAGAAFFEPFGVQPFFDSFEP